MFEKETRDTLLGAMNVIDKFLESKASLTTDNSGVKKLRRMLFAEFRSRPVPAADAPAPARPAAPAGGASPIAAAIVEANTSLNGGPGG